jgi:signal transduction histidine kinase
VFGSVFHGMLLVGPGSRIIDANAHAARLLGIPVKDLLGRRLRDITKVRRRLAPREPSGVIDAHEAPSSFALERRDNVLIDGASQELVPGVSVYALREAGGDRSLLDELAKKTRLLEESERVGRIGAWEIDVETGVVIRTPEMCRMMEVGLAYQTEGLEDSYRYYSESSRPILREAVTRAMTQGEPYDLELEMVTARGRRVWIREVCCATVQEGRLVSLFGIAQDITDLRRVAELVATSANQERARLGADLHDGLGQDLTGLSLLLRGAATRAANKYPELARELGDISTLASKAVETARAMSHGMLPVDLSEGGFAGALERLSRSTRTAFGVQVTVRYRGDPRLRPNGMAAEALYRIVQEAITNAVKHGHPGRISVLVHVREIQTVLTVSNDGARIDLDRTSEGMGFQIMKYRARMLGGWVDIQPIRGGGTRVRCVVPRSDVAPPSSKAGVPHE